MSDPHTFFHEQLAKAREKGFKPGFAAAQYREYFGDWPPRDLSDQAKQLFESDLGWQAMVEHRARQRWSAVDDEAMRLKEQELARVITQEERDAHSWDPVTHEYCWKNCRVCAEEKRR